MHNDLHTPKTFSAVQEERGPRKPKPHQISRRPSSAFAKVTRHIESSSNFLSTNHELAAQILLVAIKRARNSYGFGMLNRSSQNDVLGRLWAPLFVLRAAQWPAQTTLLLPGFRSTFRYLRELRMDIFEIEILENILLCREDLLEDSGQSALAQLMMERAVDALMVC